MKMTPAQTKFLQWFKMNAKADGSLYAGTVDKEFDRRVVGALVEKGVLERVGRSYLRTDDMEMVYYYEYRLAEKSAELRARKEALLAELKKVQEQLGDREEGVAFLVGASR